MEVQYFQNTNNDTHHILESLGVKQGGYSYGLEEAIVDYATEVSFESASKMLERHHQIVLSASTIRRLTLAHGSEALNESFSYKHDGLLPSEGVDWLIAEADGTMIPMVEFDDNKSNKRKGRKCCWKESVLCATQAQGSITTFYGCRFEKGREHIEDVWAECGLKSGWGGSSQIMSIGDGATWVEQSSFKAFGQNNRFTIDFYHLAEYLSNAQKACPEFQKEGWFDQVRKELLNGNVDKVCERLKPHIEPDEIEDLEAPVRRAYRYMKNRPGQFEYDKALANQLPIGSGMIEGGHRHVLQKRLKISGAWWKMDNASRIAQIRILKANDEWDKFCQIRKAA